MQDLAVYSELWRHGSRPGLTIPSDYTDWPVNGVAILGDFSGIQNFVFRNIPGVGGAARRLRSRSFRVSAYTQMIARWCLGRLSFRDPKLLYSAGGRFLIGLEQLDDWENRVASMQAEIDSWTWREFEGELVFHLAAAPIHSGKVPNEELSGALEIRRAQPLSGSLCTSTGWLATEFFRAATPVESRCDGCAATRPVQLESEGEAICDYCIGDQELGRRLPRARYACISPAGKAAISALGLSLELEERRSNVSMGSVLEAAVVGWKSESS